MSLDEFLGRKMEKTEKEMMLFRIAVTAMNGSIGYFDVYESSFDFNLISSATRRRYHDKEENNSNKLKSSSGKIYGRQDFAEQ